MERQIHFHRHHAVPWRHPQRDTELLVPLQKRQAGSASCAIGHASTALPLGSPRPATFAQSVGQLSISGRGIQDLSTDKDAERPNVYMPRPGNLISSTCMPQPPSTDSAATRSRCSAISASRVCKATATPTATFIFVRKRTDDCYAYCDTYTRTQCHWHGIVQRQCFLSRPSNNSAFRSRHTQRQCFLSRPSNFWASSPGTPSVTHGPTTVLSGQGRGPANDSQAGAPANESRAANASHAGAPANGSRAGGEKAIFVEKATRPRGAHTQGITNRATACAAADSEDPCCERKLLGYFEQTGLRRAIPGAAEHRLAHRFSGRHVVACATCDGAPRAWEETLFTWRCQGVITRRCRSTPRPCQRWCRIPTQIIV